MNLASECVEEVNSMMDENGIPHVRKAIIKCGLPVNINGQYERSQLFDHLQEIIDRHPTKFAGSEPVYN